MVDKFTSRMDRAKYIADKYKKYLLGNILDVGCGDAYLRNRIPQECNYIGIDIIGKPDIVVDLEHETLPFPDDYFDCVLCTEVLEHLDNIHEIFYELERVSRRYIIISLPNNYNSFLSYILGISKELKYYGLPTSRPQDRHKWFFGYGDANKFINDMSEELNLTVSERDTYYNRRIPKLNWNLYNSIFANSIWVVLEKEEIL